MNSIICDTHSVCIMYHNICIVCISIQLWVDIHAVFSLKSKQYSCTLHSALAVGLCHLVPLVLSLRQKCYVNAVLDCMLNITV